eukprot:11009862-Heterocapsa_arctica.AAC.1
MMVFHPALFAHGNVPPRPAPAAMYPTLRRPLIFTQHATHRVLTWVTPLCPLASACLLSPP